MKSITDYLDYVREFLLQYATSDEIEILVRNVARCIATMSPDEKAEYGIPEGA